MLKTVILLGINAAVLSAGLWAGQVELSQNDSYPEKPIKLIVPFGAGGGTDTYARIIKKAIEDNKLLPQPLVIVNIDGAGATVGSRRAKDADPDGYTLLVLHDAILTAKYSGTVNYGPEAFEPVAGTGEVGMVITVSDDSPYRNLQELMDSAREKPETIIFGVNKGALTHYAGLFLEKEYPGAKFLFTQSGGGAQRFAELKGGHIALTGFSIEEFDRFRTEGLRGLAFFGKERHAAATDVPTAVEQGFDVTGSNTFYWWFPKRTPQYSIDVVADALNKAMQTDYVRRRMAEIHCEPIFVRGQELQSRIDETTRRISEVDVPTETELPNFPAIVLAGIVASVVVIGVQSVRRRQRFSLSQTATQENRTFNLQTRMAAVSIGVTVVYVIALALGWSDFRLATFLYVAIVGLLLTHLNLKKLPELVLIAQTLGFGLHFLFTHVFVVDLP